MRCLNRPILCCVFLLGLAATVVVGGDAPAATDGVHHAEHEWLRLETLGDPPGARAAKDDPSARSPAARVLRGPFLSVQVNLDAFGANVVGDAANEPSLAIDPTDPTRVVIGWRQFDTVTSDFRQAGNAYSEDAGASWTFPGVIEPGVFRTDPVLDADADGNFYYFSLRHETADDWTCHLFASSDGGMTWPAESFAFGGDKAWMAIDRTAGLGRGNVYALWQAFFNCCGDRTFTRSVDGGLTFQEPIHIPGNPTFGTVAVGPDGEVYAAGVQNQDFGTFIVAKSIDAQDPGVTPTFSTVGINLGGTLGFSTAPNPAGLAGQTWVATDHSDGPTRGNVYVLNSVNPPGADPLDVMFIRSTDGGQTWSDPVRINDDASDSGAWQWFGTLSVAPNGRIDAIWNDTRNTGAANLSELYYSYSGDGGLTWYGNIPVSPVFDSHVGWPQQNKLGDYYDMVSDDWGANVAYAATFNGEQDVYFLRITRDCNQNGVLDEIDISKHTSEDCNVNGIPDECEPDCNGNTIADDCDINDGTSTDCNLNSVPDECELDGGGGEDCNLNGTLDECDIAGGTSTDCGVVIAHDCCETHGPGCSDPAIEECVCNLDTYCCDVSWDSVCVDEVDSLGCAVCGVPVGNGIPDECEPDCRGDGVPDTCEIAACSGAVDCLDCNMNDVPDGCDIGQGTSDDANANGIPDDCESPIRGSGDFDLDGDVDLFDYSGFPQCFSGPGGGIAFPLCVTMDFDSDDDVDFSDFSRFQVAVIAEPALLIDGRGRATRASMMLWP